MYGRSQLPCCCLDKYLSDSQMACLHLITDLFIHLQVTDLANSYIMEAVYAGTKIINGSWLHYPILEEYGTPYILCDKIEDLPEKLCSVIELNNEGVIDKGLLESLSHRLGLASLDAGLIFFIIRLNKWHILIMKFNGGRKRRFNYLLYCAIYGFITLI